MYYIKPDLFLQATWTGSTKNPDYTEDFYNRIKLSTLFSNKKLKKKKKSISPSAEVV